jgi:putative transposase
MLDLVVDWKSYLREENDVNLTDEIRRHVRTGRPLGSEAFIENLEQQLKRTLRRGKPGPKAKQRDLKTLDVF